MPLCVCLSQCVYVWVCAMRDCCKNVARNLHSNYAAHNSDAAAEQRSSSSNEKRRQRREQVKAAAKMLLWRNEANCDASERSKLQQQWRRRRLALPRLALRSASPCLSHKRCFPLNLMFCFRCVLLARITLALAPLSLASVFDFRSFL